ncbi:hypothetical protein EOPP23_18585 [Endozoicomonas sp. OPT23]|uniref:hypothetical protein n=1 Tax=Endozoicomonas sp. OPT23 TaxID=2072845 RepID=UPI00129B8CA0|nr:hypothetical protein [Endozoicomonas sp. OPT23]MRI34986.1 hypothetical protein [Endozoicomonas sp. OPT23]
MSKSIDKAVLTMTESSQGEYLIRVTQGGSILFGDVVLRFPAGLGESLKSEMASVMANAVLRHIGQADQEAIREVESLFAQWGCMDVVDDSCI